MPPGQRRSCPENSSSVQRKNGVRESGREEESPLSKRSADPGREGDPSPLRRGPPASSSPDRVGARGPWASERTSGSNTAGNRPLSRFVVSGLNVRRAVELGEERSSLARRGRLDPWETPISATCRGSGPRSGAHHQALPALCLGSEAPHASWVERTAAGVRGRGGDLSGVPCRASLGNASTSNSYVRRG
jgi:hypothetical protein